MKYFNCRQVLGVILVLVTLLSVISCGSHLHVDIKLPEKIGDDSFSTSSSQTEDNNSADKTDTKDDNIPSEYKSALKKAKSYSDTMHMSKAAIYDQLISEYGGQFTEEEAQYAIDNLK